ncbi:MAG: HK97 gp10 family phage protein [Anaerolineae bacterium]|nr:HK97 gp10 family phage protein [Anaerolineae bacterium]
MAKLSAKGKSAKIRHIVNNARRRALMDVGRYVRAQAAKYPPQKPTTTYRRTGTLGRSIAVDDRVRRSGNRHWVEVGTNVPYARFVEYGTGAVWAEETVNPPQDGEGAGVGGDGGRSREVGRSADIDRGLRHCPAAGEECAQ